MSTRPPIDGLVRAPVGIGFFVVGCERSGTTMLRALLDSHPDLAVPPEAYFLLPVIRNASGFETGSGVRVDNLLTYLGANPSFEEWGLDPAEVRAAWEPPPPDLATALRVLYGLYAAQQEATAVGDKTPHHVRVMPEIAEVFPESRFVHIVRDGRDVAASLAGAHFGPSSFAEAVAAWEHNAGTGHRAGPTLGDRYLEVRYERLVADPEAAMADICAFLDIEYSAAMLRYHERADELLTGLRHDAHLQGLRRPPNVTRDWRRDLSQHKIELFEAMCADLASELGYPTVTRGRPGLGLRVEVATYRLWWGAKAEAARRRRRLARRVRPRPVERAARAGAA